MGEKEEKRQEGGRRRAVGERRKVVSQMFLLSLRPAPTPLCAEGVIALPPPPLLPWP